VVNLSWFGKVKMRFKINRFFLVVLSVVGIVVMVGASLVMASPAPSGWYQSTVDSDDPGDPPGGGSTSTPTVTITPYPATITPCPTGLVADCASCMADPVGCFQYPGRYGYCAGLWLTATPPVGSTPAPTSTGSVIVPLTPTVGVEGGSTPKPTSEYGYHFENGGFDYAWQFTQSAPFKDAYLPSACLDGSAPVGWAFNYLNTSGEQLYTSQYYSTAIAPNYPNGAWAGYYEHTLAGSGAACYYSITLPDSPCATLVPAVPSYQFIKDMAQTTPGAYQAYLENSAPYLPVVYSIYDGLIICTGGGSPPWDGQCVEPIGGWDWDPVSRDCYDLFPDLPALGIDFSILDGPNWTIDIPGLGVCVDNYPDIDLDVIFFQISLSTALSVLVILGLLFLIFR